MTYINKIISLIFAMSIALFAIPTFANTECDNIGPSYDRQYCYSKLLNTSDQQLTVAYQKLKRCLNAKNRRILVNSQFKWLRNREQACASNKSMNTECSLKFNTSRTDFLNIKLDECRQYDDQNLVDGEKYAFKSDNKLFLARCDGCLRTSTGHTQAATIHVNDPHAAYAQFLVAANEDGTIALQADNGQFLARTARGNDGAIHVMIYAQNQDDPNAKWKMINLGNGNIAFKDNSNHYLCRCNNCVDSTTPDVADMHCTSPDDPWAQWTPFMIK